MLSEFLPQMRPFFDDAERQALSHYDFDNGFITEFKETKKFEEILAKRLGVQGAVAVNNGTIALSLAALAVGVKPKDEVIVPNFTMVATANSMKFIGAKPIFADVEFDNWCLSKDEIYSKITKKTRAVILVNANGRYPSYDVDELRNSLNSAGIWLIEDAAQSLGSTYPDGKAIGSKGNIATLSFSGPKIISTGQGGLIFTRSNEIHRKLQLLKDFGRSSGGNDIHDYFGINSKFTELQAIVGITQLKKLDYRIKIRKEQNLLYEEKLKNCEHVKIPYNDYNATVPWFSEIIVPKRDQLIDYLKNLNIGTRAVYPELNKQKIYSSDIVLKNSKKISKMGLWLPSHMGVTNEHIKYICDEIQKFFEK